MKTAYEASDLLKKDLTTLQIDIQDLESLTVKQTKTQYHKLAKETHPDKADPADLKQVEEFTAAFKELGNCYQRVLKHIVERVNSENEVVDSQDGVQKFTKDNFGHLNFPQENKVSFTVIVEDYLADAWEECIEKLYGAPIIEKSKGVTYGKYLKIVFTCDDQKADLTIHIYNKPKSKKKRSSILLQGGNRPLICMYVFEELP